MVSDKTVHNRLHEHQLHARRPVRVPALTRGNCTRQLHWVQEHLNWPQQEWTQILFTDKSRFGLRLDTRTTRIWRRPGNAECFVVFHKVHSCQGGTVMIWGGINIGVRTDLVLLEQHLNAIDYCHIILQPVVVPYV